jgi:hypothetical protein
MRARWPWPAGSSGYPCETSTGPRGLDAGNRVWQPDKCRLQGLRINRHLAGLIENAL